MAGMRRSTKELLSNRKNSETIHDAIRRSKKISINRKSHRKSNDSQKPKLSFEHGKIVLGTKRLEASFLRADRASAEARISLNSPRLKASARRNDIKEKQTENKRLDKAFEVGTWLQNQVELPQYTIAFVENGYNSMEIIEQSLTESDLKHIGVEDGADLEEIMMAVQELRRKTWNKLGEAKQKIEEWKERWNNLYQKYAELLKESEAWQRTSKSKNLFKADVHNRKSNSIKRKMSNSIKRKSSNAMNRKSKSMKRKSSNQIKRKSSKRISSNEMNRKSKSRSIKRKSSPEMNRKWKSRSMNQRKTN